MAVLSFQGELENCPGWSYYIGETPDRSFRVLAFGPGGKVFTTMDRNRERAVHRIHARVIDDIGAGGSGAPSDAEPETAGA